MFASSSLHQFRIALQTNRLLYFQLKIIAEAPTNTVATYPKIMLPFRFAFFFLILVEIATQSCAQVETGAALCRTHRAQCVRDRKARNANAMRDSCQKCYHTCRPLAKKPGGEPISNWTNCLNDCVRHDCIGSNTANGVPVSNEYRCKVYGRSFWFDYEFRTQQNALVKKSCGTCAEACNFPAVMPDRGYCENRCSIRVFRVR